MTYTFRRVATPVFIATLIFFALSVLPLSAGDVPQIEPAKIRLSIAPGSSKTGTIKIYNLSADPKSIKAYFEDWVYLPVCDGTKDFRPAGTTELSAASWITFSPSECTVPAYGKQIVNYTVKVPPDAKGGHYAVLFFEGFINEPNEDEKGVSVNVAVRVASLFYIEPEGTVSRKLKIDDLKVSKEKNKFNISASLSNIGNVDINTKGTFFIIDRKGMVYARGEFNEVYTFPGDSAIISAAWSEPLPQGKYDLIMTIDISKALEGSGIAKPAAITKEAAIEIGEDGQVLVEELK